MKLPVRLAVVLAVAASLHVVACGSAPPPVVDKPVVEEAPKPKPKEHASIEYDLGSIDPSVAKARFDAIKSEWNDCYRAAHEKNEALAGMIKFSVRTNKDGSVKWAYVSATDLGDRTVEKCVLDSVRQQNFGAPMDAKEGEIKDKSYGWELDGDDDRPADPGDVGQVLPALNKAKKRIADCREKGGAQGQLTATIYVAPKGKPRSVGIAASDPSGDGAADCVVEVLSRLTYVNKSSWVTKVTVELP